MDPSLCMNGCEGKLAREGYDTCFKCASMEKKRVQRKIKRDAMIDLEEDNTVQKVVCNDYGKAKEV
jgi:hypothetical protein